jgi:hypothetical protein
MRSEKNKALAAVLCSAVLLSLFLSASTLQYASGDTPSETYALMFRGGQVAAA